MIILTLRTDKPESEIGLFDSEVCLVYEKWEAHRQLAETLHHKIKNLLDSRSMSWNQIEGIVAYKGPGSFTGLRIGLSVANALAYANNAPIIAEVNEDWIAVGVKKILVNKGQKQIVPEYGAEAHITLPKK